MVDFLGILVFSALPSAVAAVGLAGLGQPAPRAGVASLVAAVLGAVVWPGLIAGAVPGALPGGLGTSAQVLYMLFGGLMLAALGGALTGSNAASNALFMPLQVEAARGLDISELLTAAVQNVAGSHASMLAPQRMVLSATGLLGREGDILRASSAPAAVSVGILAILGMLLH